MKKGVTLVELIISIAVFSIAMVGITYVYLAAWNTRAVNTLRQDNEQFSEIIAEHFITLKYDNLEKTYINLSSSQWKYFNDKSDIDGWFVQNADSKYEPILVTPQDNENTYSKSSDKKYGAFIKIDKGVGQIATGLITYHIYIKVIQLDKGQISKSVKDIYESGN